MVDEGLDNLLSSTQREFIQGCLQGSSFVVAGKVQSLWGGQGAILRLQSTTDGQPSVILKQIVLNRRAGHPRGWATNASFERKVRSYDVEMEWYRQYAHRCTSVCRVPRLLGFCAENDQRLILMEDLDVQYPERHDALSIEEASRCLTWLAHFHACFMHDPGQGLWPEGCYWHLATRQDELTAMAEGPIKQAASILAEKLSGARYQTLVHGDAKVANFCFQADCQSVAAVDFQYVGRGCGIRDVAYFMGSCLSDDVCRQYDTALLSVYFSALRLALTDRFSEEQCNDLESEWRDLYAVAWTDFTRFLLGWMPGHEKLTRYSAELAKRALAGLE